MKNIIAFLIIILTSFGGISQIESNVSDTSKSSLDSTVYQHENATSVSNKHKESGFASGGPVGISKHSDSMNSRRIRLNEPNLADITSETSVIIHLIVKIDEDGNVRSAKNTSRTSTTDQILINKVISIIIKQVKYNKKPDSGFEEALITININAK